MNSSSTILEGRNLQVKKGHTVILDIPGIQVQEGEFLSVIGPNGAGKTTLLQALCCLTKPNRGGIYFRGQKVGSECNLIDYRRKVTMVFQEPLLFDTTVFGNVASGLKFRGMRQSEAETIVMENLERFGIGHLKNRSARTLSSGEARKTGLARALALRPEILFLDEPFGSLDPLARDNLFSDLEKIIPGSGLTVILATHDCEEALRLSHRIAVMDSNKIIQIDESEKVLKHPVNNFVASFYRLNKS
ncbi:MAG: ATP-binding cassette domain-containing protein [Deltaproteobacteria bacterium]